MGRIITRIMDKIRQWKPVKPTEDRENVSRLFRFKYTCFKDLLASNAELLNIITDFEEKLRGQDVFGMSYIRSQAARAVFHTLRMVKSLDDLSGHRYAPLFARLDAVNLAMKQELDARKGISEVQWVIPYSEVTGDMVDWVGGKNANLGELRNKVRIPGPEGFAISTRAYDFFLDANDLIDEIDRARMDLDPNDPQALREVSEEIQELIISAEVPAHLGQTILTAYDEMAERIRRLSGTSGGEPLVALRSSAIGEDSELSYAGQYLSVLNVPRFQILQAYKEVIASLYTPRAISYRLNKGMRDEDIAMSVACVEMISSVASGVMYSRNPSNFLGDDILITAVWGLGPYAVDGIITPDSCVVSKDSQFRMLKLTVSTKTVQLIADPAGGVCEAPVEEAKQASPCLTLEQVRTLAEYALHIEQHYRYPQDIEWALDPAGRLVVLQARPLHLEHLAKMDPDALPKVEGYRLLAEGSAVASPGVGCGPAFHVTSDEDLARFPDGGVLVARHSSPQFVMVMPVAAAIVTDSGSVTGHMASLAREFGIPTLLDAKVATTAIPSGVQITVDAYSGRVYEGQVTELMSLQRHRESAMKDTPVYQTLRRMADLIVPLHLVNPRAANFTVEHCTTLHDIMRFVHELSYREMFQISDLVSDTSGAGALKLVAPIPLDLHIIDLGGGLSGVGRSARRVTVSQIASVPFSALLKGMLHEDLRGQGPRPVNLGGFFSVVREQMFTPNNFAERFGDRSYAIISDEYLNFSSRIGYHYSVLDCYCGDAINKNYITFSFKGGAADVVRRSRRARSIGIIFDALGFQTEVREDRVDARMYKYERSEIEAKLDILGRMIQFTRQMDMLMHSEQSVQAIAQSFLNGDYHLEDVQFGEPEEAGP